jgi:uncharacterized protein YndB with AHSA1/START domain
MAIKRTQFKTEFIFRASPTIVYQFLTNPACLVRWFCEEVDVSGTVYTFYWDGDEQVATLVEDWEDELLRFEWEDAPSANEFLEFRLSKSAITEETILSITDFCDLNDVKNAMQLWETQIAQMKIETGG